MKNINKKEISNMLKISSASTIDTDLGCTNIDKKEKKKNFESIKRTIA